MKQPSDAYREGYEKGKAGNLAGHVSEAIFSLMKDDPGGYYAAGYRDGAAGKKFHVPSPASPSPQVVPPIQISDTERAWFRLCDDSEFIPTATAREHWERLKNTGANPTVYMIGLHPFYELSCPHCGATGHYKGRILGRVRHPECGFTWYVRPPHYIRKQLAAAFHSGVRLGGSAKDEAARKGDRVGGWMQGFLVFYFVAAFRLVFAIIVLIPIQTAVSLGQQKSAALKSNSQ